METADTQRLRQEIERTLRRAFDPADVLPRLAQLARIAGAGSEDGAFANRQLAELLVERSPWRAALYAKRALAHRDDDRGWAILAFSQTLLGNFRCAVTAYKKAIACAPANPWYAHNLGHLLDVALGEPARAVPHLRTAHRLKPENSEMIASFAHALARTGEVVEARALLERGLARYPSRELSALLRWLDQGAPSRRRLGPPNEEGRDVAEAAPALAVPLDRPSRTTKRRPTGLSRVLARGLGNLPLDARQRARALALARDVVAAAPEKAATPKPPSDEAAPPSRARTHAQGGRGSRDELACLAAACAYAIVYVDHVPLTQAEVAAPFRVAVGQLRGRFAELRARLDLIPGDVRYATTRR
jgi:tetratricopeptide (TPR) repeat protein